MGLPAESATNAACCLSLDSGTSVDLSWSNPRMITDCFGVRQWDLSYAETIFVQGVFALLKILISVAIWVYTWKVCKTEPAHHRPSMFGLEETTSPQQQEAD